MRIALVSFNTALAHPIFGTGAPETGCLAELVEGEAHSMGDGGCALFAGQVGIPVAMDTLLLALSIMVERVRELASVAFPQALQEALTTAVD